MSTQRRISQKQGFTLIELMVVIVIIGILSAIAIPKLMGISAKAKAKEAGINVKAWITVQQAHKMEHGSFGTIAGLGYKLPGENAAGGLSSTTGNFDYTAVDNTSNPEWKATSKFSSSTPVCPEATVWSAKFASGDDDPTVDITVGTCEPLTPDWCKIGKKGTNCS